MQASVRLKRIARPLVHLPRRIEFLASLDRRRSCAISVSPCRLQYSRPKPELFSIRIRASESFEKLLFNWHVYKKKKKKCFALLSVALSLGALLELEPIFFVRRAGVVITALGG